ncbi:hypothetical protein RBU49_04680 [Clostridium sp. MB40-C1]|uniref:hypothetical protein n=1 Tax=Clostridium sp. MB40-C1 TaxID=3070996 RepID=UPI0027E19099|nr:hypothetical protein [Clostridium sp. MB40-C1]WMJ81549.1 hypothetical protein RBU49_04680 [Clostridium sp. MB40-C1]
MKNSILEIIKNDRRVKEITGYFEEQFLKGYNSIKDKDKILNVRDTLFRRWYYSAMIELTYINPSFLINEIAQQKIKGDYVVMSHIKPEFGKGNKVKFTYNYKYFSIEEHPVVEDLIKLVEFSSPSVHMDLESGFILKNGEKFIDEINYRNAYYLLYLLELAKEMKLIEEMPSIGTTCLIPAKEYDEFLKLSKEEQLYKVVDNSINVCVKNFNEQPVFSSKLTRKEVMNMLDNGVINDNYFDEIDKNISFMEEFIEHARNSGNDQVMQQVLNSDSVELAEMLSETYFGIYIDMWFISVFGYYLGIIIPNYVEVYDICDNMNKLTINDTMEKLGYMFDMNQAHDLTPLGEKIMSLFKKVEAKKRFQNIKENEFDELLVGIKEEMNLVLSGEFEGNMEEMMNVFGNFMKEFEDEDDEEDDDDYGFDDYLEKENKEVTDNISKFFDYLVYKKNLKESTAQKHSENMYFFYTVYLPQVPDSTGLEASLIDRYMDFYIEKVATSKTNVKDQLVSFKHYASYMESIGLIDETELDKIKEMCKKKDYYADNYEKYWEI